jgi:hypothetical protein
MIDFVKEVLEDRICADYKKVLELKDIEEQTLVYIFFGRK